MADYFGLRGWLTADGRGFTRVVAVLDELKQKYAADETRSTYLSGWCWSETPFNATRYIHYGGDVKELGLGLFKEVLERVAALDAGCTGFFHADGDDGRCFVYLLDGDRLTSRESVAIDDLAG